MIVSVVFLFYVFQNKSFIKLIYTFVQANVH